MKLKSIITLLALLAFAVQAYAQIDRTTKPEAGPAPKASFPEFQQTVLTNGLKIVVITNDKQPVINYRLLIKSGSEFDGEHSGVASFTTDLLTAGTTTRSNLEFAKEEDFLGLRIGASAADDQMSLSGSGLKKHNEKLLELMTDALNNPVFPEDELSKLKKQTISGLMSTKKSPNEIMSRLKITIGYNVHPYSNFQTEKDVEAITRKDLTDFHATYFIPNNASLAVVGDVTMEEILPVIEKYFGPWKKGSVPVATFHEPKPLTGRKVHLVDLGATQTQTTINVGTSCMPRNDPDYVALSMANSILGGGFSGRLFQNLREKHGFTYGVYSGIEARRTAGLWGAAADVRRSATDSAITQIILEMDRMRNEKVGEEELEMHKQYASGRFLLSLERASSTATRVQNIDLYDLPEDYYKNYVQNLMQVSTADVQRMASKYMNSDNIGILAVGDASVIRERLQQFGPIYMYDTDMNPAKAADKMEVDIDAVTLIEKHLKAMGGREALLKITDRIIEGDVTMQFGPQTIEGTVQKISKAPNKEYELSTFMMGGNPMVAEVWNNGETVYSLQPMKGGVKKLKGDELAEALEESRFNYLLDWKQLNYLPTVTAKKEIDGVVVYVLELEKPYSDEVLIIDAGTFLLFGKQTEQETPGGRQVILSRMKDYKKIDGVMIPFLVETDAGQMSMKLVMTSVKQNTGVDDAVFEKSDEK